MSSLSWGLIREQMTVQIRVRTLNVFSLALYVFQPAVFTAVGMLLSRAAGNATPDLVYNVIGGGIMACGAGLSSPPPMTSPATAATACWN
jgi:hypothetical protein